MKIWKKCKYHDKNMEYAYMERPDGKRFLISAEELLLHDKYLRYARRNDKGVKIVEPADDNPLKIVYGMMLVNPLFEVAEALKLADDIKTYALFDINQKYVNISVYEDIQFDMDYKRSNEGCEDCEDCEYYCASETNEFPFAALMNTSHTFNGNRCAVTIFPALKNNKTIFEKMVNRPFALACIKSCQVEGLTLENWKKYIDKEEMLEAAERALFVQ